MGEVKGFTWQDYRDLIIATHHNLSAPAHWCRHDLNIRQSPELAGFAAQMASARPGCSVSACGRSIFV